MLWAENGFADVQPFLQLVLGYKVLGLVPKYEIIALSFLTT
jgi:hypothetical protein